jgi:hypothetical protein
MPNVTGLTFYTTVIFTTTRILGLGTPSHILNDV